MPVASQPRQMPEPHLIPSGDTATLRPRRRPLRRRCLSRGLAVLLGSRRSLRATGARLDAAGAIRLPARQRAHPPRTLGGRLRARVHRHVPFLLLWLTLWTFGGLAALYSFL